MTFENAARIARRRSKVIPSLVFVIRGDDDSDQGFEPASEEDLNTYYASTPDQDILATYFDGEREEND